MRTKRVAAVMLASAFQRLLIYEGVFGFTELRLYSHVFMIWLAVVTTIGVRLNRPSSGFQDARALFPESDRGLV